MYERPSVIERAVTPRGEIQLQRRGEHYEVISNGCFLMATYNGESERALVDLALRRHPGIRRVLVGGLGVGYTLRAALDAPGVERVTVVEIEPKVVEWNRGPLAEVNGRALEDPRTRLVVDDLARFLLGRPEPYDLVALDTDNGPEWTVFAGNQRLWSPEGLERLNRWLAPGGVLAFWSANPAPAFEALLRRRYREVAACAVGAALSDIDDVVYLARGPAGPADLEAPEPSC
ncbi:spermidine synthase [Symbiobacterium terraclitae]|uniref:Spermidine synthase n=1 Tax=Symbiobacterium terraclitae TaxID=557451 RepID=A0ABS4JTC9_9FIRM|nr:spermine/spermidine synthase [Symbiobacterium terraclitae]MBP2018789.1 spermidine synthase [Symbiobacterium terraclitae]